MTAKEQQKLTGKTSRLVLFCTAKVDNYFNECTSRVGLSQEKDLKSDLNFIFQNFVACDRELSEHTNAGDDFYSVINDNNVRSL
jgi:hypothetical protein